MRGTSFNVVSVAKLNISIGSIHFVALVVWLSWLLLLWLSSFIVVVDVVVVVVSFVFLAGGAVATAAAITIGQ